MPGYSWSSFLRAEQNREPGTPAAFGCDEAATGDDVDLPPRAVPANASAGLSLLWSSSGAFAGSAGPFADEARLTGDRVVQGKAKREEVPLLVRTVDFVVQEEAQVGVDLRRPQMAGPESLDEGAEGVGSEAERTEELVVIRRLGEDHTEPAGKGESPRAEVTHLGSERDIAGPERRSAVRLGARSHDGYPFEVELDVVGGRSGEAENRSIPSTSVLTGEGARFGCEGLGTQLRRPATPLRRVGLLREDGAGLGERRRGEDDTEYGEDRGSHDEPHCGPD